jgi:menaquinone-dependent protoporphyrinogen oxidase
MVDSPRTVEAVARVYPSFTFVRPAVHRPARRSLHRHGGSMRILVAFASQHGSTRGIAAAIARTLHASGHEVDLRAASEVADASVYDAVVLGSAVHDGDWMAEAADFARREIVALAGRPVWLFSVGLLGALGRPWRSLLPEQRLPTVAGLREAIGPCGYRLFTGAFERGQVGPIGRLIFRGLGGRFGDLRNWEEVDGWAADIARELATGTAPSGSPSADRAIAAGEAARR